MTMRAYDPLAPDHPLVDTDEHRCAICHERFKAADRTVLIPVDVDAGEPGVANVPALPAHAECVLHLSGKSPP